MRLFLLFLFVFPCFAYSADYTWTSKFGTTTILVGAISAEAACRQSVPAMDARSQVVDSPGFKSTHAYVSHVRVNDSFWHCTLLATRIGTTYSYDRLLYIQRVGDQCGPSSVWNPELGKCDDDECKQKEGQTERFTKGGLAPDSFATIVYIGGQPKAVFEQYGCFDGCAVSIVSPACTTRTTGAYHCRGDATHLGTKCGNSSGPAVSPTNDTTNPVPQTKTEEDKCVFTQGPGGVMSCVNSKLNEKEGQNCGTFNGVQICADKVPEKDTEKTDTTITGSTNSDGTTTTTKTDTKTKTTCTGIDNKCTTKTTTKTTTTVTSPNGSVTSETTECEGEQCPGGGNDGVDTDGDGFGDCDPSKEDCGEGNDKVEGEPCDVSLVCEGDVIQCAILRQEKENNCKWVYGAAEKQEVANILSGEEYEIPETEEDVSDLFNNGVNKGRWMGGNCPAPRSISIMGRTYQFSWQPFCDFAVALAPLFVALASIFFVVYVGRGLKG